ncbi:taste receptor type 2 member 134-like [Arvicanthis niloticus]|uniref:taste receptor type 2 member 134-like n=1 Tax=Arvicanthis niloticus TaxID=61156 RepID=UPI0014868C86|nr:taste receptor type 2 member 134-like [Arvicanthis niloticus]
MMLFSRTFIFMVIFCMQSLAALLQNGFMATVLGRKWLRSQRLPEGDMIVACLAASRFCLHGVAILNNFLAFAMLWTLKIYFYVLWDFINTVNFWFTTWLAIFYCVKISSFSHPIFFWIKWRISRSVPRLLLGSLIIGGLSAISSAIGNTIVFQMTARENYTVAHRMVAFYVFYFRCHAMLMWVIPLFLFLLSIISLMFSLYRHLEQMKYHRPRSRDYSTQAHTMALKSLAFFLIFYTSYVLFLMLHVSRIINAYDSWHWAWEVIIYMGISLHSTVLILSNHKLRKALKIKFPDLCLARSEEKGRG